MSKKINIGLIGFGGSSRVFHLPIISSMINLDIVKIQTSKQESIEIIKNKYPSVKIASTLDDILTDENIDLVIVATPNTTHYEIAKKSLLANKHVIVEKPFTITSKEADDLIKTAQIQNKILSVYQNRRWDSDFLTVKKIIESNILGKLVEYEAHFDRFRNYLKEDSWRENNIPGSGILYDLGSHLIDQAIYIFGIPDEITADIRMQRNEAKIDDYFELILGYKTIKVTLKAGMLVREPLPRFILTGQQGSFIKYGMDVQESALKEGKSPKDNSNWGEEPEETWGIVNTQINGLHIRGKIESEKGDYRAFYENVYKAILGEENIKVKPHDARNTIRIIELAIESSKQKRTLNFS